MPGRKPLTKRDWPFGARSRRELLKVVLSENAPPEGWTASELARAVHVSENGSLDPQLAGLCQWKILRRDRGGRFLQTEPMVELGLQLRTLLEVVEAEPDAKLKALARRRYRRS
jgi:hypothetical protein